MNLDKQVPSNMDLFAQLQISKPVSTGAASASASATAAAPVQSANTAVKIITVAIEKIKNRTVTVVYEMDHTLDSTVKTPEEFLSKLKKKICNSNGFIRKPEKILPQTKAKRHEPASDDEDEEEDDEEDDEESKEDSTNTESDDDDDTPASQEVSVHPQYVIQGNHSNAICRYIYSLGVKNIIRTGTA